MPTVAAVGEARAMIATSGAAEPGVRASKTGFLFRWMGKRAI